MTKKIYLQKNILKNNPPRYAVFSMENKSNRYGMIDPCDPYKFDGWEHCKDDEERFEIKQFQQIFDGLNKNLQEPDLYHLDDVRLKLPENVIKAMVKLNTLAEKNDMEFNFSQTIISNIVNLARTLAHKMPDKDKSEALQILNYAGIGTINKNKSFSRIYADKIKAIFSELNHVHNKIERLQMIAQRLFEKDKKYSIALLDSFASGEASPNRWMIACAITVIAMTPNGSEIIENKLNISPDEFIALWVEPLLHKSEPQGNVLSLYMEFFSFQNDFNTNLLCLIKNIEAN